MNQKELEVREATPIDFGQPQKEADQGCCPRSLVFENRRVIHNLGSMGTSILAEYPFGLARWRVGYNRY